MNLLFDLDGTLTDPKEGIVRSLNHSLAKFNLPLREPSFLEQFIGPPLRDTFRLLLNTNDAVALDQAVAWYRERYILEGYRENLLYDGIYDLLAACKEAGHRLFVATYKRKDLAESVLSHFQLIAFFNGVYGCDLDLTKAELLSQLLNEQSFEPAACLMIGDRKGDIEAGRANNIPTAGVLWGYGTREELAAVSPNHLANTPSDLAAIISAQDSSFYTSKQ